MSLRTYFPYTWMSAPKSFLRRTTLRRRPPTLEPLESRQMLSASVRAIDGSNNNLAHPEWGSAGVDLLRVGPAAYVDGLSTVDQASRPSAREISNTIVAQTGDILNNRDLAAFIYAWGQFLDHDLDLTPNGVATDTLPVKVPTGDPYFDPTSAGDKTIGLVRSIFDASTGTADGGPRQQINTITAFVDGSQVYGSNEARELALRTLFGGRLKTSEGNLLPLNTLGLPNDNAVGAPTESLFVAGDSRANENIELTSMQTLFLREHNRLADKYAAQHPTWTDEQVYQAARRIVIAELQAITYNEFLPALLGPGALSPYRGYNPRVNPGIVNEFSTAAFRVGHSMLGSDVEFLDNVGNTMHDAVELRDAFFNPQIIKDYGIDGVLKYLASDRAQEIDNHIVDDVRNFLFGAPGSGGFDLAALNIQRGRDHGLADYNSTRVAYGLPAVTSFADITSNVETQQALEATYGDVNKIDLWVGGLAEDHVRGASVGRTFYTILADQFQRLRDGDRFWYQRSLSTSELAQVQGTSLAGVIRNNTLTTNLQENVFFFRASISGRVFFDGNVDGKLNGRERGMAGLVVQLLDLDGNVIASATTGRDGCYLFDHLDLGTYRVQVVVPTGLRLTSFTDSIDVTRGQRFGSVNYGLAKALPSTVAAVPTIANEAGLSPVAELLLPT